MQDNTQTLVLQSKDWDARKACAIVEIKHSYELWLSLLGFKAPPFPQTPPPLKPLTK